jgi:TolA-binding protein
MKKLFFALASLAALAALGIPAIAQVDTSIYRDSVVQDPLDTANKMLEYRRRQQEIQLQQLEIQRREIQLQQLRLQQQEIQRQEVLLQQLKRKQQEPQKKRNQTGQPIQLH